MSRVTVIIPARNELYLRQTVQDILAKAAGDIEVIVVLDGAWHHEALPEDGRLIIVHRNRRGMRESINSAVAMSNGEYLMKIDAHCIVSAGYDEVLKNDCDKDWIVIPRRYSLDADNWTVKRDKPFVDYEYLGYPQNSKKSDKSLRAWKWFERTEQRIDRLIDENMTFQGSCWFTTRDHFMKRIGYLQNEGYGTFIGEAQELGLKTWLGGGKIMTNKKVWYAHLWKGQPYRKAHLEKLGFEYTRIGNSEMKSGNAFVMDYWLNNRWSKRVHDLFWLVDRFSPFPTCEMFKGNRS